MGGQARGGGSSGAKAGPRGAAADATMATACGATVAAKARAVGSAESAVMHDPIDAHPPPGAHGTPHEPFMPHGPFGIPAGVSATRIVSAACGACAARCTWPLWPPASRIMSPWPACMRQSVPLASSMSWTSRRLESTAVMRDASERRMGESETNDYRCTLVAAGAAAVGEARRYRGISPDARVRVSAPGRSARGECRRASWPSWRERLASARAHARRRTPTCSSAP